MYGGYVSNSSIATSLEECFGPNTPANGSKKKDSQTGNVQLPPPKKRK